MIHIWYCDKTIMSAGSGNWGPFDQIVYRVHFFCPDHDRCFEMSQEMCYSCHAQGNTLYIYTHTHTHTETCMSMARTRTHAHTHTYAPTHTVCLNNTDQIADTEKIMCTTIKFYGRHDFLNIFIKYEYLMMVT
jgi:hypothetical protein